MDEKNQVKEITNILIYNILIWGCGYQYNKIYNCIKLLEIKQVINVIGITDNQGFYEKVDEYSYIKKEDLRKYPIDLVIVASDDYLAIREEALRVTSLTDEKIIPGKVVQIPGLDLEEYLKLLKNPISIISNNCWGGLTYHFLGLKFSSPFINLFMRDEDYLKLLFNLDEFLQCDLEFLRKEYERNLKRYYPVCGLNGKVEIYFNHYSSFEEAREKWNIRLRRLNRSNLFFMMQTRNLESAKKFDELSYKKKVCFVPSNIKMDFLKSAFDIEMDRFNESSIPLFEVVNGLAAGKYIGYNVFELLNGKINRNRIR